MDTAIVNGEENSQLPTEWNSIRIGENFDFTVKPKGLRFENYQAIPFVPMERIPSDRLFFSDFVLRKPQEISSGTYFEEGDLLVSKITPCFENGKQGIATKIPESFGVATTEVIPIKAKEGVSHLPFLAMYLLDSEVRKSLSGKMEGATGRQRLAKSVLKEWIMPFPPLPEQHTIAAVLAKIQVAVEVQDKIVATLKELKAATMAKLFREGLCGEPLKQTEIGEMPESWGIKRFGDFATLQRGYDLPVHQRNAGNIPVIGSNGIVGYHDKAMVKGPGVCTGRSGTMGLSFYCETDFWPLNTALFVVDFHGNDPLFVHYFFERFDFQQFAAGVSVPTLNRNLVHEAVIAAPNLEDQTQISRMLRDIDTAITLAEKRRTTLKSLFSSMLHLLMTGQKRVIGSFV